MTREKFHQIYEQTPEDFRAELIGGIVHLGSRVQISHGRATSALGVLLFSYAAATLGVESTGKVTVILGGGSEPEPDALLRVLPEHGGQTLVTPEGYIRGAPELIAEVATSEKAIELHAKKCDYERHGVLEYVVVCLGESRVHWFDLRAKQESRSDADGVYRIRCFPGLWIHGEALLSKDYRKLLDTLNQGLATPEHAAFVQRLAAAKQAKEK
jgi:Uma2 family endonuclease